MLIWLLCQHPKTELQRHQGRWWYRNGKEKSNWQKKKLWILPCTITAHCHDISIRFKYKFLSRSFSVFCLFKFNPRVDSICSSQKPLLYHRLQFHHQSHAICKTNLPSSMSLGMEAYFPLTLANENINWVTQKLPLPSSPQSIFESELNLYISLKVSLSQSWITAYLQGCSELSNRVSIHVQITPPLQELHSPSLFTREC